MAVRVDTYVDKTGGGWGRWVTEDKGSTVVHD